LRVIRSAREVEDIISINPYKSHVTTIAHPLARILLEWRGRGWGGGGKRSPRIPRAKPSRPKENSRRASLPFEEPRDPWKVEDEFPGFGECPIRDGVASGKGERGK